MLVVDPEKRINWEDLFTHPINYWKEKRFFNALKKTHGEQIPERAFGYFEKHQIL